MAWELERKNSDVMKEQPLGLVFQKVSIFSDRKKNRGNSDY